MGIPHQYCNKSAVFVFPLILGAAAFLFASCDSGEFVRDNERDPSSDRFRPEAPSGLRLSAVGDTIKLTWEDRSDFEQGYGVERSIDGRPFEEIVRLPANSNTYSDSVPIPFFEATYRVTVLGGRGENVIADSSLTAQIRVADPLPIVYGYLRSEDAIEITWAARYMEVRYIDIDRYHIEIERGTDPQNYETIATINYVEQGNYFDEMIEPGLEYHYRVRVWAGDWLNPEYRSVSVNASMDPPSGLHLTPNEDHVQLSWMAQPARSSWTLERCTHPGDDCITKQIDAVELAEYGSYSDYNVDRAYRYSYRVKSRLSSFSSPIVAASVQQMGHNRVLRASGIIVDHDRGGDRVLTGTAYGQARVVDVTQSRTVCTVGSGFQVGAISGDGRRVAILGSDIHSHDLYLAFYDCLSGEQIGFLPDVMTFGGGSMPRLTLNEAGTRAYLGSGRGVQVFDYEHGAIWSTEDDDIPAPYVMGITDPSDRYSIEVGASYVLARTTDDGSLVWRLPNMCSGLSRSSISADGQYFACLSDRGSSIHRVDNGDIVMMLPESRATQAAAFSTDGNYLATYGTGFTIWDLRTGEQEAYYPYPPGDRWNSLLFFSTAADGFLLSHEYSIYDFSYSPWWKEAGQ